MSLIVLLAHRSASCLTIRNKQHIHDAYLFERCNRLVVWALNHPVRCYLNIQFPFSPPKLFIIAGVYRSFNRLTGM